MIGHNSPISGVAAHGRFVATAGYDNQLILWDADRKQACSRSLHDHLANQVAFSPDGRYVVSSSSDHTARLWTVPELKLVAVFANHDDDVEMSAFHPSRELVATASRDHCVRVYDFSGKLVCCMKGHTADVISVAWSEDGLDLISSSDDGTIRRWSLESARMLEEVDLGGVETDTVVISPEGVIYAGNDDGEIVVIDGGNPRRTKAHDAGIKRLVYQAKTSLLVSLSYDRAMCVWSARGGVLEPVARATMPAEIWPRSCAFLDEKTLAFATFGSSYAIYSIDQQAWDLEGVYPTPGINAVTVHEGRRLTVGDAGIVHADGRELARTGSLCNFLVSAGSRVFTGGQMGQVFDALTGELLHQHRSPLNCGATFERNGLVHVIIGAYTGEGLVFSVDAAGQVKHVATLQLHANAVKAVAASGGEVFSVCADAGAAWFATDDFRELARAEEAHDKIANGCVALPAGCFVSVSRDHKLRIWENRRATVLDTPHDHSIKCVSASLDGRYIASGSYFGAVAVYDRASGRWSEASRPTPAGISSITYDAANRCFVASSYDGRLYPIHPEESTCH